jgi:hypothetical protein
LTPHKKTEQHRKREREREREKYKGKPPVGTVLEEATAPGHGSLYNLIAEGEEEIARAGRGVAAGNLCHKRGFQKRLAVRIEGVWSLLGYWVLDPGF